MSDGAGRPIVDARLIDDLNELAADFAAEGLNDTAATIRMAVMVAFHEASHP
jgi:hypothetical protein